MKSVQQILIDARALILRPESWTHSYSGRDSAGLKTNPCGPDACCWCAVGAVMRVSEAFPENDEPDTATALIRNYDDACTLLSVTVDEINIETGESPGQGIVSYNDYSERTHAEMIRLFDRAIAAAPRN